MKLQFEPSLDYECQAIEALCDLFSWALGTLQTAPAG